MYLSSNIKKTQKEILSFDAMKFGSENDLKIAITELKWLKKSKGTLVDNDFEIISQKYKFPIGFLKKGVTGFSFPDDYMISKSRWFPVLFSWVVLDRLASINLFKLQIDYIQTKYRSYFFLAILGYLFLQVGFMFQKYFEWSFLELILWYIPFILFLITLSVAFKNSLNNRKMKLDEYSSNLEEKGLKRIIRSNEEFIRKLNIKWIVYAGSILLKKMESSPQLLLFPLGSEEKEKTREAGRFSRLLSKLLRRKPTPTIEKEVIPIFYAENPYVEYRKRIEELIK